MDKVTENVSMEEEEEGTVFQISKYVTTLLNRLCRKLEVC